MELRLKIALISQFFLKEPRPQVAASAETDSMNKYFTSLFVDLIKVLLWHHTLEPFLSSIFLAACSTQAYRKSALALK